MLLSSGPRTDGKEYWLQSLSQDRKVIISDELLDEPWLEDAIWTQ